MPRRKPVGWAQVITIPPQATSDQAIEVLKLMLIEALDALAQHGHWDAIDRVKEVRTW